MSTDDYLRDQEERTQRRRTQIRRDGRSKRRHLYLLCFVACACLAVLGTPSVVSHSSLGRGIIASTMQSYGFSGQVTEIANAKATEIAQLGAVL